MSLEESLHDWAESQTELVALLGEAERFRFFKLKIPDKSKTPASVQQRSGRNGQQLYCGPDGAIEVTLQLDHYARTWPAMKQLAETWRMALQDLEYPVMMGSVRVKVATLENEFDLDDPEPGLFRRSQSWTFWVWFA